MCKSSLKIKAEWVSCHMPNSTVPAQLPKNWKQKEGEKKEKDGISRFSES